MKSIITKASSIAKAIEDSWKKTGKPQNFSVKVLEEEEKNFLGMTRKPAKIAFFFEETSAQKKKQDQKYQKTQQKRPQRQAKQQTSKQPLRKERVSKIDLEKPAQKRKLVEKEKTTPKTTIRKTTRKSPWTDEMVTEAKNWTAGMLREMNLSHINFSVKASGNNLKFHFDAPLMKHTEKQKSLFRNFAFLIMQSIRYKFKKQFRNLKAVFTSN